MTRRFDHLRGYVPRKARRALQKEAAKAYDMEHTEKQYLTAKTKEFLEDLHAFRETLIVSVVIFDAVDPNIAVNVSNLPPDKVQAFYRLLGGLPEEDVRNARLLTDADKLS